MPYGNRKNYRKKAPKRNTRDKKNFNKYPNTRAVAIQRMDLVQPTRLMKCVFDDTYILKPAPTEVSKGSNTMGLCFNLTDLFNGPASTITTAAEGTKCFWGAVDLVESKNQSGNNFNAKPYGFTRYIGDGGTTTTAPYRSYMVVGGKWSIRCEQVHKTGTAAPATQDLAKLLALCTRYGRNTTDALSNTELLQQWQNHRGVKQVNMTALAASGTNRPSSGSNQQATLSGTFSSKKWFDVKDIKDNLYRLGGSFNDEGTYVPPEEDCFLQIGLFDRIRNGDDAGYVMPDVMIRFCYEAIVLCTETNQLQNIDV